MSDLFVFSYCPWDSLGKNAGTVCHFLFQWATFCQDSSLWPVLVGWPCTAWFIASCCDPGREFNEMNMLTTSWLLSCHFKQQLFKTILCTLDNFKFMGRLNNRYRDYPSPTYVYHPLLSTCPTRMTDLSQANVSWFIYHYHPEIMTYIDSSALLYILWAWILSFLMTFLSL